MARDVAPTGWRDSMPKSGAIEPELATWMIGREAEERLPFSWAADRGDSS